MDGEEKNSVLVRANDLGKPWQEGEGQKGNKLLLSTCCIPGTLHSYFTLPRIINNQRSGGVVNFWSPKLPLQK